MIVLDASAVLELLLFTEAGERVAERLLSTSGEIHAPHLIDLEVAQVLRRCVSMGELHEDRARQAIDDLHDLRVVRHEHRPFLPRFWELRDNVTAYDAAYLVLAEALEAPLLTRDAKLSRAPGHRAEVKLV